jgi:hypothetical protein
MSLRGLRGLPAVRSGELVSVSPMSVGSQTVDEIRYLNLRFEPLGTTRRCSFFGGRDEGGLFF